MAEAIKDLNNINSHDSLDGYNDGFDNVSMREDASDLYKEGYKQGKVAHNACRLRSILRDYQEAHDCETLREAWDKLKAEKGYK